VIPLFNLSPTDTNWLHWQRYYLDNPEAYPCSGYCPDDFHNQYFYDSIKTGRKQHFNCFQGIFHRLDQQDYRFTITIPASDQGQIWQLVTLRSHINERLQTLPHGQKLNLWGHLNHAGQWLLVENTHC
jgi:hypothetical protein